MTDLPMIAATEWARANATEFLDPVEFGGCVAKAHAACLKGLADLSRIGRPDRSPRPDRPASSAPASTPCAALQAFEPDSSPCLEPIDATEQPNPVGTEA